MTTPQIQNAPGAGCSRPEGRNTAAATSTKPQETFVNSIPQSTAQSKTAIGGLVKSPGRPRPADDPTVQHLWDLIEATRQETWLELAFDAAVDAGDKPAADRLREEFYKAEDRRRIAFELIAYPWMEWMEFPYGHLKATTTTRRVRKSAKTATDAREASGSPEASAPRKRAPRGNSGGTR